MRDLRYLPARTGCVLSIRCGFANGMQPRLRGCGRRTPTASAPERL